LRERRSSTFWAVGCTLIYGSRSRMDGDAGERGWRCSATRSPMTRR